MNSIERVFGDSVSEPDSVEDANNTVIGSPLKHRIAPIGFGLKIIQTPGLLPYGFGTEALNFMGLRTRVTYSHEKPLKNCSNTSVVSRPYPWRGPYAI
jgi:hypothetical protein